LRSSVNDVIDDAIKLVGGKSIVLSEQTVTVLKKLTKRLLSRPKDEETKVHIKSVSILRDSLYKIAHQYRQSQEKKLLNELLEMLMALHYSSMYFTAVSFGFKEMAAKCSITLLKYPDLIPHDKAFFVSGMASKEQGNINLAFLLLNR
jgi:hypothetical protein